MPLECTAANAVVRLGPVVRFGRVATAPSRRSITMTRMTTAPGFRNEVESEILTPPAMRFLERLSREFELRRTNLLEQRQLRQQQIDAGQLPDFLPETA